MAELCLALSAGRQSFGIGGFFRRRPLGEELWQGATGVGAAPASPSATKAPLRRGFGVAGYFLALPYKPLLRLTPGRLIAAPWRPAVMPFR